MKQYIGSKIVQAESAMKCWGHKDQVHYAGLILTQEQYDSMVAEGWEHTEVRHGYKVIYRDGYESWSPKEVFEEAYRQTDAMSFGLALEACKMGKRIARKGWNGKGMYVFLIDVADLHTDADLSGLEGKNVTVLNCFAMKCADDSICLGWLASQADMLADDWVILE